jgi:hypothetical protein
VAYKNYAQVRAVQAKYKEEIKKVCPRIDDGPGIYFLTRTDENGINYFYIGQAVKLLSRMSSHMTGYQHIDLSLKKRGWYSEENPCGWRLNFKHYAPKDLDDMEQYWILEYTKKGYQARYNKTAGGQGEGKEKINEFRPQKGYRDGLKQGHRNASREVSHLFEKHLDYKTKSDKPNKNQQKAMEKFEEFLNEHKMPDDNGKIDTAKTEVDKYGRSVFPG